MWRRPPARLPKAPRARGKLDGRRHRRLARSRPAPHARSSLSVAGRLSSPSMRKPGDRRRVLVEEAQREPSRLVVIGDLGAPAPLGLPLVRLERFVVIAGPCDRDRRVAAAEGRHGGIDEDAVDDEASRRRSAISADSTCRPSRPVGERVRASSLGPLEGRRRAPRWSRVDRDDDEGEFGGRLRKRRTRLLSSVT